MLLLVALASGCGHERAGSPVRRVILVTCDTLRADRLGCYGYERDTSPRLDAFAREGIVFDSAYAAAPLTRPSISSLLAGRLPDELGVSSINRKHMPAEVETLAEVLGRSGMATGAVVSNWVLRRAPEALGEVGVQQGFDHYDDEMKVRERNREAFERRAPETTDAAAAWIRERAAAGEDRFFLWVHYQDPHGPYVPPESYAARFERPAGDEAPLPIGKSNSGRGQIPGYQALGEGLPPEAYRIRYDGEIRYFDDAFGRLLDELRAQGFYEGSLILFTADHGESLGEGDYWFCHGENLSAEVVRVPLVVRYPDGVPRPRAEERGGYRRVASLVGLLDLFSTVVDVLGVEGPPVRGTSLAAETLPEGRVLSQTLGAEDDPIRCVGITDGRWQVVLRPGGEAPRLHDLASEGGSRADLAEREPERVHDLLARHRRLFAPGSDEDLQGVASPLDEETLRALKALGYY
jgi:arylsulfatase